MTRILAWLAAVAVIAALALFVLGTALGADWAEAAQAGDWFVRVVVWEISQ